MTEPGNDIARLFQEDPLKLTRENIDLIILRYREARHMFNAGEKAAGSTKKVAPKEKGPKVSQLDLKDLGL